MWQLYGQMHRQHFLQKICCQLITDGKSPKGSSNQFGLKGLPYLITCLQTTPPNATESEDGSDSAAEIDDGVSDSDGEAWTDDSDSDSEKSDTDCM